MKDFLASYPNKLERDVVRMCEPPLINYNDFTLGNWPESMVASYMPYGGDPKDIWAEVPCGFRIKP